MGSLTRFPRGRGSGGPRVNAPRVARRAPHTLRRQCPGACGRTYSTRELPLSLACSSGLGSRVLAAASSTAPRFWPRTFAPLAWQPAFAVHCDVNALGCVDIVISQPGPRH
eukprot:scaffold5452_cov127-Isochrysis_galbana.AAC.4